MLCGSVHHTINAINQLLYDGLATTPALILQAHVVVMDVFMGTGLLFVRALELGAAVQTFRHVGVCETKQQNEKNAVCEC